MLALSIRKPLLAAMVAGALLSASALVAEARGLDRGGSSRVGGGSRNSGGSGGGARSGSGGLGKINPGKSSSGPSLRLPGGKAPGSGEVNVPKSGGKPAAESGPDRARPGDEVSRPAKGLLGRSRQSLNGGGIKLPRDRDEVRVPRPRCPNGRRHCNRRCCRNRSWRPVFWPWGWGDYYDPAAGNNGGDREQAGTGRGNVELDITPRDCEVYVDGVLYSAKGRTRVSLPIGRWTIEIRAEGYETELLELEVKQGVRYTIKRSLRRDASQPVRDERRSDDE